MNKVHEVRALAEYVQGMADATENVKLDGGYFDCGGGEKCTSDHK